jgi:hypothetical protein
MSRIAAKVAKRSRPLSCDGLGAAGLRRSCHQNHNVTISASRPKSTKALGLNMAARISEVGLNAPQVGHRITPGHTVAAQRLQTSLGKKQPPEANHLLVRSLAETAIAQFA